MPRPVATILAAAPREAPQQALVHGVERTIAELLARTPDVALSRVEIGDAFKDEFGAVTGLRVDRGLREAALAIASAMLPRLAGAIQATSDVLDLALTNLVRRGAIEFALVELQPHFWARGVRTPIAGE